MKLDYDCIRDILISLEDILQFDEDLETPVIKLVQLSSYEHMQGYSIENITYCSLKLEESGFINARVVEGDNAIYGIFYFSITFNGHQYLDSIHSNVVWKKTKSSLIEKGLSLTFDLILNVAPKMAMGMLNL